MKKNIKYIQSKLDLDWSQNMLFIFIVNFIFRECAGTLQATYICILYFLKVEHSCDITFHRQVTLFMKRLNIKYICMKPALQSHFFMIVHHFRINVFFLISLKDVNNNGISSLHHLWICCYSKISEIFISL